ncbi:MAG: type II toxin-antitoxin system VapC family toxin [Gemmatimonadaceae bacterium]
MLILDTNVYLDVDGDAALAERVAAFLAEQTEAVGLSSVVLAELLIGVTTGTERRRLLAATIGVVGSEHVLTPTDADWQRAGDALNQLGGDAATRGRSFWNDLLIAASCARAGATLLTRNADDFRRIRRVLPVTIEPRPA